MVDNFRSSQPKKMPSRALPPSSTLRQPPLVKGTSQSSNAGARSPQLKTTVLPKKFGSSQPKKMPSPSSLPTVVNPPAKGKSKQEAPKLGGELPPMGVTAKPVRPRAVQVMSNMAAPYGSTPVKDGTILNRPRVNRAPDQTPRVKDGTIYPRSPMPGRSSPRRPTR